MALPKKLTQFLKKKDRKSLLTLGELIQKNTANLGLNDKLTIKVYTNRYWFRTRHYDFDSMSGVRLICLFYYLSVNDGVIERSATKEFMHDCLRIGGFNQVKGYNAFRAYFSGRTGYSFLKISLRQSYLKLIKDIKFVEYDYAK